MSLLFLDKVSAPYRQDFAQAVNKLARKYRMNANWLMGVMNSETGGALIRPKRTSPEVGRRV